MSNWDDEDDSYCTAAADFQDARRVCDAPGHSAASGRASPPSTASGCSRISCASTPPGARRTRTCCATARSSSASASTTCSAWAPRWIATGHYARLRHAGGGVRLLKAADAAKDQSYFLHGVAPAALARTAVPDRRSAQGRGAPARARGRARRSSTSRTAPASASSASGRSREFLSRHLRTAPGPHRDAGGRADRRAPRARASTRSASARACASAAGPAPRPRPGTSPPRTPARNALIVVQDHDHPLLHVRRLRGRETCTGSMRRGGRWASSAPSRRAIGRPICACRVRARTPAAAAQVSAARAGARRHARTVCGFLPRR